MPLRFAVRARFLRLSTSTHDVVLQDNLRQGRGFSSAKRKLEKVAGAAHQITEIVVKPKVVVGSASELARMPRILEKAKENCFISNSIKTAIKIEP